METLFDKTSWSLFDLSDIQVLNTVSSLHGTEDQDNLFILSQESRILIEFDRNGTALSLFSFQGITDSAEGVTIDADGNIYVVAENGVRPRLYVLSLRQYLFPAQYCCSVQAL